MANLHRIFIAINLDERLRKELNAIQDKYLDLPARWVWPKNLHITLVFLGNANDQEVLDICKTASEVARRHDPFDLTLNKICYGPTSPANAGFEGRGPQQMPPAEGGARLWRPRMVWAVGEKSPELGSLQKDLESALCEFNGASYDAKRDYSFSPHITLARVNQSGLRAMESEEIPQVDETIQKTFLVESIEVMESELKRGGPTYTILESLKLGE